MDTNIWREGADLIKTDVQRLFSTEVSTQAIEILELILKFNTIVDLLKNENLAVDLYGNNSDEFTFGVEALRTYLLDKVTGEDNG